MHTPPTRRVAAIRHLAFEDLGLFGDVFAAAGWQVTYHEAGLEDLAAPLGDADLAVVLGGPIGVYEADRYPFLNDELAALKARLSAGRPTLGICLGAQLMAAALGARVYPGGRKELGWGEVKLTEAGRASPLAHLAGQPVLHWHGDTFDLPADATLLASTELYPNQAFSLGHHALALQFHAEVDSRRIEQWLIGHTGELSAAGIDIPGLRARSQEMGPDLRAAGKALLSDWLERQG
ncbi:MAG: glutamine amidotransferase [Thiobacillus sp.]|nr:glutamine amidotransferase [Thiobacillus sp.]